MNKLLLSAALLASSVAAHADMFMCSDIKREQEPMLVFVNQTDFSFRNRSMTVLESKLPASMSLDGKDISGVDSSQGYMVGFNRPTRTFMTRLDKPGKPPVVFVGQCREMTTEADIMSLKDWK